MPGEYPGQKQRAENVAATAGSGKKTADQQEPEQDIVKACQQAVKNFTDNSILVVEGVPFNWLKTLKTIHRYLNSVFEGESEVTTDPFNRKTRDENGDDLYFYNIILPRNAHATKNIDIDRNNLSITTDCEDGWFFTFLLRNEFQRWMEKTKFGETLNTIATDLPNFGKVILKKCGSGSDVRVEIVDLRNVVWDTSSRTLKDSPIFLERVMMFPWQIMEKVGNREDGGWDKEAAERLISQSTAKGDKFIKNISPSGEALTQFSMTDTMKQMDVWEGYGWFEDTEEENGEPIYAYKKVIIGSLDSGHAELLYEESVEEEDFVYREIDWFRKLPGRPPVSNSEVMFDLQVQMNEVINEVQKCLRNGTLQIFQTARSSVYRNLMQDAQNGDVIVTRDPLTPLDFEMRSFQEFQTVFQNIEAQADRLCNTPDVVTGDTMPTNTPFRLSAQLGFSAAKIFDQAREDIGMALTDIFFNWILPEIIDELTVEHIIEVSGSVDEMKMFEEKYRKYAVAQAVKKYILQTNHLPMRGEVEIVENALSEQMRDRPKKVEIERDFFSLKKIRSLRVYFDLMDERRDLAAERDTLLTLVSSIGSNPDFFLNSEEGRALMSRIMEFSNISPLMLASLAAKPVPKAQGQAGARGGTPEAAPPGEKTVVPESVKNQPVV